MRKIASKHNIETLSWLTISNIIGSLSQWCLLIILVKFYSTEDVGYFTYGMALAAPIFMLSDMQLKSVLIVEPFGENDNFRTYQLIRFITTTLATLGLIIYSVCFREINWIILIVIVYKASESLTDILNGYLQKCDRMIWMSKIGICKTLIALTLTLVTTIVIQFVLTTLLSLIIVSVLFYIIINRHINSIFSFNFSPNIADIIGIIKKAFPLGLSVFIGSYIVNYPRLSVEGVLGVDALAYYGSYSYLAIGIFQIYIPVQIFLRQRLSVCFQKSDYYEFTTMVNKTIIFLLIYGAIIYITICVAGKEIISIIYNENYTKCIGVLKLLIISQLIVSITNVLSISILSFNVYTRQVFISAFAFILILISTESLINKFDLYGGGYASIVASLASFVCYSIIYYNKLKSWKERN